MLENVFHATLAACGVVGEEWPHQGPAHTRAQRDGRVDRYDVVAFDADNKTSVYASY